ncbi:MAG: ATP-binding cassette domain-containing protein [Akkermansiaceae bacterium]|nr:ATP-binding cassette domain-containing protein [Akkermansiaceae bacterium]
MALLEIDDLTLTGSLPGRWLRRRAETRTLLDGLSLTVEKGGCTAIVCEEGGGKLPLTLALFRLHPVRSGAIRLDGEDIVPMSERHFHRHVRRRMQGVFPEDFQALNPRMRLEPALRAALALHEPKLQGKDRARRIEKAMELAGAPLSLRGRLPGEMSPADRQRGALARALLVQPRLLVGHDITRGLDASEQAEILNRLGDLRDSLGLSLLLMTHDLAVAAHMGDPIHILSRGKPVESGAPESIVHDPQHDYTRMLVAAAGTR